MTRALHIERVHWSPSQRRWRQAARHLLHDVTVDVPAGEFVGLIGPNGSGKTSLLRCAFRYAKPHLGRIVLGGESSMAIEGAAPFARPPGVGTAARTSASDPIDVWDAKPRRAAQHIAVLQQELPDDFGLSVEHVVRMGRTPFKHLLDGDTLEDATLVEAALRQVDLWADRDRAFDTLSGGEKQRALLARACVQQPTVLILDEPTNHLDLKHQIALLTLVRRQGITTLSTMHDLNLAAAFCDRLYVIDHGGIVAQGRPDTVLTASMLRTVFGVDALVDPHPVSGRPRITLIHT